MAPFSTPQLILAGQGGADEASAAPNPATPIGGPTDPANALATPSGAPQNPLASLVNGLGPAPPKGGISESPADQLRRQMAKNADSLISSASDPSAPGAWARAIMGGAQSALAGVSNIGTVPKGGGALYGVGKVMQANQEAQRQKAQDAERQKQQQFDNDYKIQEQKDREQSQNAAGLLNDIAVQKALRSSTTEAQDEMYNKIYSPWKKAEQDSGAQVIREGMTDKDLQELAQNHKAADDPNGTHWLAAQLRHQDGWQDVTDANGNVQQQLDPKTGKPNGLPMRQATYSLMTYGDPLTVTPEIAAQAEKYGLPKVTEGTKLQPQDAALLKSQIGKAVVDEHAADVLALDSGMTKEKLEELQQKADYRSSGAAFAPWLNDAKGDAGLALENMRLHSQEVGPDGQPTPMAQQAKKQYDTVLGGMGPEIIKGTMTRFDKEEEERVKDNLKQSGSKDKALGNPELSGQNYLDSIQDAGERAMVQELGTGRMDVGRMEYLIARTPRVAQELALAYPDLDKGKIGAYIDASKKFASGQIANQINAAGTGMAHLSALLHDNRFQYYA